MYYITKFYAGFAIRFLKFLVSYVLYFLSLLSNRVKNATLLTLRLYQKTLSPDTGWFAELFPHGYCRFHPTCSEYTYRAIDKYGTLRGSLRGLLRIVRCNPFTKGGIDQLN